MHHAENPAKCTVRPLRGRSDLLFVDLPRPPAPPRLPDLSGYVRLGLGGPLLGPGDAARGLLLVDGSWRHAERTLGRLPELEVRSLPELRTAYPRRSKLFDDPAEGLATVEALYAALHRLGRPTAGILGAYRWSEEFLRLNASQLAAVVDAAPPARGRGAP